jgi:hypothetical protein
MEVKHFSFTGKEVQELQLRKYAHIKKTEVTLGEKQRACNWERSMSDLTIPVSNTWNYEYRKTENY